MQKTDVDEMYVNLADHFQAASQLFGQFSTPESAQALFQTLATGDQESFNHLVDSLDFPILGKCAWVRELVTHVIVTSTPVTEYYLRDDLTPQEWGVVWRLAARYQILIAVDLPFAEGPFLEELKARGLVRPKPGRSVIANLVELPGPYQHICV